MAVPAPSNAAAAAHEPKLSTVAIRASASAWVNIPAVIKCLRPHRSDRAPVSIWPTPQTAG
ncbi:Uncharacterised protein [Mycobacteroides abscessus subsp. abscessus]|nr:Uncharacterised protein [Mycobacteroides abscessus subsp. abscessus]